jgi:hypothetical protein
MRSLTTYQITFPLDFNIKLNTEGIWRMVKKKVYKWKPMLRRPLGRPKNRRKDDIRDDIKNENKELD